MLGAAFANVAVDCTNATVVVAYITVIVLQALKILFDPDNSKVTLKSIKVIDSKTIDAEWILEGFLKFPWHPNIPPVEGKITL